MKFKKGQSGNPAGRPKAAEVPPDIKELARVYTTEAIERLAFWLKSDNPKASVAAAQALLDRGYGKAPQQVAIDATLRDCRVDDKPLSTEEWDALHGAASTER